MGYSDSITLYSIRRRAETDFAKAIGREGARELMCHEPNSRALEKFYLDHFNTTDVTALALGEAQRSEAMDVESHQLTLTKLSPRQVADTFGKELNAAFRQALVRDEQYANCKTKRDRKNRERVIRRITLTSLLAEAHEQQLSVMTTDDYEARKDEILRRATDFNRRLIERIKTAVDSPASSQTPEADLDLDEGAFDNDFEEDADEEEPEADVEDQLREAHDSGADVPDIRDAPEEQLYNADMADYVSLLDEIPYKEATQATMRLLFENGLGEYSKKIPSECPLCVDDHSIREEDDKNKIWQPNHLPTHLRTDFHSKSKIMQREYITPPSWLSEYASTQH